MSQSVTLDPATLPKLDILSLAQSGKILRAERETPEDGIPAFITQEGWDELVARHSRAQEPMSATAQRLLPALERITARLMGDAAQAATEHYKHQETPSLYALETDLFPSDQQTRLLLACDQTHTVACAIIGTPAQLSHLLKGHSP